MPGGCVMSGVFVMDVLRVELKEESTCRRAACLGLMGVPKYVFHTHVCVVCIFFYPAGLPRVEQPNDGENTSRG